MSTNASAAPDAAPKKPAKSKKLLLIVGVVVLLLAVAGAAAAWVMSSRHALDGDEEGAERSSASAPVPAVVPTFLPMETMVVNLADPGGERFAQIGISLELVDSKTADTLTQYMPSIRSSILLLVSQRTSDELLLREGKEQLAYDILREVSRPLGIKVPKSVPAAASRPAGAAGADEEAEEAAPRRKQPANPVRKVHFSGFIIQ